MFRKSFLCLFLILILISAYFSDISDMSSNSENTNILFIVKGVDGFCPDTLKLMLFQYCPVNGTIKILYINEEITILRKNVKSRTLKEMFYSQSKDKQPDFMKNEIERMMFNTLSVDYYVVTDARILESFIKLFNENEIIQNLGSNYFSDIMKNKNYTESLLFNMKIIKHIINDMNRYKLIDIIKFLKNNSAGIETNLKFFDYAFLYNKVRNSDIGNNIQFADITTVKRKYSVREKNVISGKYASVEKERTEINGEELGKMAVFFSTGVNERLKQPEKLKVEVLNSSSKTRMAIKAVNKIRENKFDVFEWGTAKTKYKFTVIFDLIGNYDKSLSVKNILGCGEIIFRPLKKTFVDISVFLGEDCIIYDKLDRIVKS